jgi:penicillin-binding protein 1C
MLEAKKRPHKFLLLRKKSFLWGFLALIFISFGLGLLDYFYPLNLTRFNYRSQVVLDEKEQLLSTLLSKDGYWRLPVQLEEVSPNYRRMLLAFEDKRFYYHPGVDPVALIRALRQWKIAGRVVSGGSTLTMQVVRLLEPRPRTFVNKLKECARALQLEYHFTKKKILEMYLTLAPYGGNIEGIRAASLSYFGKEPLHLTIAESALLIAIPQKPNFFRPDINPTQAKLHRDKVVLRMKEKGQLSSKEASEALEDALPSQKRLFPRHALHLAYAVANSKVVPTKNLKKYIFKNNVLQENLQDKVVYHSTLNLFYQKQLEEFLFKEVQFLESNQTISAVIVDNRTHQIKAYVGSADFFNENRAGQVDMIRAIRSPGSTLKPFIYALAFDDGLIHPDTVIHDIPTAFGHYTPNNLKDIFHGTVTIRDALQQSLNVPAVALLDKLGPGRFSAHLGNLGIQLKFENENVNPSLPLALGGVGMSLYDLMSLYTALANLGQYRPLIIEKTEFENELHQEMWAKMQNHSAGIHQTLKILMTPKTSSYITQILEEAPAPEGFVDGRAIARTSIAFKTGTSYGYRDAWAIGYTPDYTVGIWVGKPNGTPSLNQLGRTHALPILFKVFNLLPEGGKVAPGSDNTKKQALSAVLKEFKAMDSVKGHLAKDQKILKMLFPKNGIVINLEKIEPSEKIDNTVRIEKAQKTTEPEKTTNPQWRAIPLNWLGGQAPFYVFENGYPLPEAIPNREIRWQPKAAGFVELTVLDSMGQSATVNIEVRE